MEKRKLVRWKAVLNHKKRSRYGFIVLFTFFTILCMGCASGFQTVAPQLPDKFEKIGHAEGKACGTMLFPMVRATTFYR